MRSEFAIGFVAHLSFLDGLINPVSELTIHDYVDDSLRTEQTSTLVFTVETARACSDTSIVLSAYLEKLSIAMLPVVVRERRERQADILIDAVIFDEDRVYSPAPLARLTSMRVVFRIETMVF